MRDLLADLDSELATLAPLAGKKAFIFLSGGFEFQPGYAMASYALGQSNFLALEARNFSKELDQIVRGLEGGTLKLDAAVQAFERGVKLRRHCEAKLAEVEARVEALVQRADGSLGTRPLE